MPTLLSHDITALQLLMTEDIYQIGEPELRPETKPEPKLEAEIHPQSIEPAAPNPAPVSFNYLGENNKYFLILVDDNTHRELNTPHKEMILKMMQAKGYELRDLAILNLNRHPGTTFSSLKEFFVCNRLAIFGIPPSSIGLPSISSNQAEKYQDVKILASYSLAEMDQDIEKKKQFWAVMKSF